MIENFELVTITAIILILTLLSFTPLIYLKYFKDLNNYIEIYNNICNNKSNIYTNEIKIKNTYMWNISTYFFDFKKLEKYFFKINDNSNTDKKEINRFFSIIDGEFNIMKIYNNYLHYSLPLFIVLWIVFILNIYNIYIKYTEFANTTNNNTNNIYYLYSTLFAFFNVAIFTIIFSLILKKITEVYKDTNLYDYIMLLKELDIIIKEKNTYNKDIIDIISKYSGEDIESIEDIYLNEAFIRDLIQLKKTRNLNEETKLFKNNNNYKLTLENIDKFELYNIKSNLKIINEELDDITQFITSYIILIFMSIYILSQSLKSNFTIIACIIILIYLLYISTLVIKKRLE